MKITAIMPCRNSAWVLGLSARALLMFCDEVIILNHASTDGTLDLLHDLQREDKRLKYYTSTDETWYEMKHRNRLLESAREWGATHIVTIDDDEVLAGDFVPHMRDAIADMPSGAVMQLPWMQLRGGIDRYISTGMWANNRASVAFLDRKDYCWRAQNGYDHHHRHPMGTPPVKPWLVSRGCLLHLQMASRRRLCAKQALYVMNETIRWPGRKTAAQLNAMYGPTVHTEAAADAHLPRVVWERYEPLMKHLDLDAEPWQLAEVKRLWELHGPDKFRGLDLYGVL